MMRKIGHSHADSVENADIVILNTCTVVDTTEKKMILRISELKKTNKHIIVTGCMAKVQPSRIKIRLPDSLIIPPDSYNSFSDLVSVKYGEGKANAEEIPGSDPGVGTTSIIPIAQGCLGDCTYCITRFARGRLSSYPEHNIADKFVDALRNGSKEILITAQDTACFGFDIGTTLPKLLRRLLAVDGDYRIRIGMMNPESLLRILDDLMDVMRDPRIYKFIHVPAQSGSDRILKRMGRRYTAKQFIAMIERIRSMHEDMTISTDMISGFPGETDEDHNESMELMRTVSPDIINVTRFSPRPGTEAKSMDDQIHGRVSKERSRELTEIRYAEADARNKELVGRTLRVLITEEGKKGTMIARTGNYKQVIIPDDHKLGDLVDVEITGSESMHLFGCIHAP
jgi:MiaB-like tRNA modifying enzyme